MSVEKNMNARIQHKHDIEANWNKALNFIPKIAEIIVYDIDELHDKIRVKIGDGVTNVKELPFFGGETIDLAQPDWNQTDETALNFIKNKPDVILRSEIEEIDAIELVTESNLVSPAAAEDGSIYIDENDAIYSL